jgi:hypothetical protein
MAPVVEFLRRQEVVQQGNQTQEQLAALLAALHQAPAYQRAVQNGGPAIGLLELKGIVDRVQQGRFNRDSAENTGDREARLAQRNANGMIDWVVTQLSDNFHEHHEAFKENGVQMATLADAVTEVTGLGGVFDLRLRGVYEAAIEHNLDIVRDRLMHLHAEAA